MSDPRMTNSALLSCAALLVCLLSSGCRMGGKIPESVWPVDVAKGPQTPAKLAAIWSDTVLYMAGKPPTRGFGGRVYFYDGRSDAIKVDGQLVVYVYDDDNPTAGDRPAKRFIFNSEQLDNHYAGSELGPSYNVWIPWDAVGGPTRQLSLVPFFIPAEGGLIAGEHTRHRRPGTSGEVAPGPDSPQIANPAGAQSHAGGMVRQVGHNEDINLAGRRDKSAGMRTTTIHVPQTTRDRLSQTESVPRSQRSYIAGREAELPEGWDHYERAKFSAMRAAEYRDERFTRQRSAPWERQEPRPPGANPGATESHPESAVESASQWAQRYRRQRQPNWASPESVGARARQPATHSAPTTRPAPAAEVGRPGPDRAPWPPDRAGWRSDPPSQSIPAAGFPTARSLPTSVTYGR